MSNRKDDPELIEIDAPLSDMLTLFHLITGEPRPTRILTRKELDTQNRQGFIVLGTMVGLASTALLGYHALTSNSLPEFYQPFLDTFDRINELRAY